MRRVKPNSVQHRNVRCSIGLRDRSSDLTQCHPNLIHGVHQQHRLWPADSIECSLLQLSQAPCGTFISEFHPLEIANHTPMGLEVDSGIARPSM